MCAVRHRLSPSRGDAGSGVHATPRLPRHNAERDGSRWELEGLRRGRIARIDSRLRIAQIVRLPRCLIPFHVGVVVCPLADLVMFIIECDGTSA